MILSKSYINQEISNGNIRIDGFKTENMNPNSYDLTLSNKIAWYPVLENVVTVPQINEDTRFESYGMASVSDSSHAGFARMVGYLDPAKDNMLIEKTIPEEGIVLLPHVLYLCMVNEKIWSNTYVAELTGKSTLARLGIIVHHTAGYANLGHEFKYVLEVQVVHPIRIYPNMKIAQVYFHTVKLSESETPENLYNGNYTNTQVGNHISPPRPIKGYDDVVNTRPTVEKIAVSAEDVANYHKIKTSGDLEVKENGEIHSKKFKNVSEKIVPYGIKTEDGEVVVSSIEFPNKD